MKVGTTTATATTQGLIAGRVIAVGVTAALLMQWLLRNHGVTSQQSRIRSLVIPLPGMSLVSRQAESGSSLNRSSRRSGPQGAPETVAGTRPRQGQTAVPCNTRTGRPTTRRTTGLLR